MPFLPYEGPESEPKHKLSKPIRKTAGEIISLFIWNNSVNKLLFAYLLTIPLKSPSNEIVNHIYIYLHVVNQILQT